MLIVYLDASLPVVALATEVLQVENQFHDPGVNMVLKQDTTTPMCMEDTCQNETK